MLRLVQLMQQGELRSSVDDGSGYASGPFHGLESVKSAVEVSKYYISGFIPNIYPLCNLKKYMWQAL